VAVSEKEVITKLSLEAVLQNMGIQVEEDELLQHIKDIKSEYK
jgi:FKBP-type peptidyl-prolyl cis-trans isomerase (trigger factor)